MLTIAKQLLPFLSILIILAFIGCETLDTKNNNKPDRDEVLSVGADLSTVLQGGYISWWQGIHDDHPGIALGVAADAFSMSWGNFGAQRFGFEPRKFLNNRSNEDPDYRQVVEDPWFGCLSAVSTANDVINALNEGISIDNGGAQDQSILASAKFLRALSWGYVGLIFDQGIIAETNTDISQPIPFVGYKEMVKRSIDEIDETISIVQGIGPDFTHTFFNGITLDQGQFLALCHSYAARFLAQWPRTKQENQEVEWTRVLEYANAGIDYDFAPLADGNFWMSYQKFTFAETGQGPFWARVDQRLVAAMAPGQPARYPEVVNQGENPIVNTIATSNDQRLETDFIYLPNNNFQLERGEWHFSHYKHNRNLTDPGFAGDGSTQGPMPVFLAADNELLKAEAYVRSGRISNAIEILNKGTRRTRGNLPEITSAGFDEVEKIIMYERAIELFNTAPMSLWFDRRRFAERTVFNRMLPLGGLQKGTPAQLPVPAIELDVQGNDPYNFGGPQDSLGIHKF